MTRENTVNVPKEPTEAMLDAGGLVESGGKPPFGYEIQNAAAVWEAMLSAVPLHEGEDWNVAPIICTTDESEPTLKQMVEHYYRAHGCEDWQQLAEAYMDEHDRLAAPPSVEVFGSSSLKGEDTHRVAETPVVGWKPQSDAPNGCWALVRFQSGEIGVACKTLNEPPFLQDWRWGIGGERGTQAGWPIDYVPLADVLSLIASQQAAVSTAEQVGTSVASEPNPSVEVETLFLLDRLEDFERRVDDDQPAREFYGHVSPAIARLRAALSRKQEPGVPTPGGEE